MKMRVPLAHEIQSTLLHPTVEVASGDLVGEVQNGILRIEYLDGSLFHTHAFIGFGCRIWGVVPVVEGGITLVVLHHQRAAARDEIEQPRILAAYLSADVIRANAEDDCMEAAKVDRIQLGRRDHLDIESELF